MYGTPSFIMVSLWISLRIIRCKIAQMNIQFKVRGDLCTDDKWMFLSIQIRSHAVLCTQIIEGHLNNEISMFPNRDEGRK